MNNRKLSQCMFFLIITILLLVGCSGQVTVKPTETATSQSTSKYTLKCNIDTQNYGFEITGETGTVTTKSNNETTNYNYDSSGQMSGVTVAVNRDLLFENSQHNYHIEGTITVNQITNGITYDITATGDTFGNSPQTCKKP